MIIVLVIGFLLFVAVFAVRGHEERGYIHSDERDSTKKSTIVQSLGIRDFTKLSFIQSFTRGEWWIR